ncbi:hypothetical protein OIU80_19800 [Flavobacterium sp. LS1R47]|jgi:hypothetical protein|uniref:Uncharacterized protein n=1 Tax=Flavobacterium frigoritolerans TaxID=2987686 RepID=A0A9X3CAB1_9FLAO|nr:hypothetical protein [Flavobacterium frigoritolerans]MCV9934531.1 hypothetical protein [Flavobacterium frigoritolerans]
MATPHQNTIKKALLVTELLDQNYEQGNQAKMMHGVLRSKISKVYPMSYRTLQRYVKLARNLPEVKQNQLTLF